VIVNQLFARQFMPGLNPLGQHFKAALGGDVEIVGVVKDSHYRGLREKPVPLAYFPAKLIESSSYSVLVRTRVQGGQALANIRRVVRSVDPKLPIFDMQELQDQIDRGISSERVLSFLSALFSGLATLLCSIGIYGLIAYAVSHRTREIGVRFAIGAQKSDVAGLFLRESLLLVAAGVLAGVPLALASTSLLDSLLFGVRANDAATLTLAVLFFLAAGLLASVLPVWKATRIEPLEALRYE
jgi:ABC-type antimicrobial peptide transport system permease subunit